MADKAAAEAQKAPEAAPEAAPWVPPMKPKAMFMTPQQVQARKERDAKIQKYQKKLRKLVEAMPLAEGLAKSENAEERETGKEMLENSLARKRSYEKKLKRLQKG